MKACSFYSTHWVAKATCLLICNGKPLLIKENNQRAYSYLELRCRKPAGRTGKDSYFMTPNHISLFNCHLHSSGQRIPEASCHVSYSGQGPLAVQLKISPFSMQPGQDSSQGVTSKWKVKFSVFS